MTPHIENILTTKLRRTVLKKPFPPFLNALYKTILPAIAFIEPRSVNVFVVPAPLIIEPRITNIPEIKAAVLNFTILETTAVPNTFTAWLAPSDQPRNKPLLMKNQTEISNVIRTF